MPAAITGLLADIASEILIPQPGAAAGPGIFVASGSAPPIGTCRDGARRTRGRRRAGVYNRTQPTDGSTLLDRKWSNVEATGADIVATGNPGCHSWIEQASDENGGKVKVLHTLELLESSFSGLGE